MPFPYAYDVYGKGISFCQSDCVQQIIAVAAVLIIIGTLRIVCTGIIALGIGGTSIVTLCIT